MSLNNIYLTTLCWSFCLVLLSGVGFQVQAQGLIDGKVASPIPPSPNAASLGKFIETPVSLHTGLPQINIPIYTLTGSGGLKVPITLSYHASGVKINDIASWVGAGWALQYGGVINREVRGGFPDELAEYGFYTGHNGAENNTGHVMRHFDQPWDMSDDEWWSIPIDDRVMIRNFTKGLYDTEPDMYHFSYPGGSGTFIIGRDSVGNVEHVEVLPEQRMKVDVSNFPDAFTITDEAGFKYVFNDVNITRKRGSHIHPFYQYNSSWYLTEIISPRSINNKITYAYDTTQLYYQHTFDHSRMCFLTGIIPLPIVESKDSIEYSARRITSISSNTATLVFNIDEDNERVDMPGDYPLDNIEIKDKSGKTIKTVMFNYSYFGIAANSNRRLRLDSLYEVTATGRLPAYRFSYDPLTPPGYRSPNQDYWGYYNGKNNTTLIPQLRVYYHRIGIGGFTDDGELRSDIVDIVTTQNQSIGGADRAVDTVYSQAGVLKRIQHPTGGHTEYEYENHDIDIYAGKKARIERYDNFLGPYVTYVNAQHNYYSEIPSGVNEVPRKMRLWGVEYDFYEHFFGDSEVADSVFFLQAFTGEEDQFHYAEKTIYIGTEHLVSIRGTINGQLGSTLQPGEIKKVGIEGVNGTVYHQEQSQSGFPYTEDSTMTFSMADVLAPGWYRFYVQANTTTETDKIVRLDVTWHHDLGVPKAKIVGGLRVKRVKVYDGDGATPKVRRYIYRKRDDPDYSSGMLMNEGKFSYVKYEEEDEHGAHSSDNMPNLIITASPTSGGSGAINSVYYTDVTVLEGENGAFGKTEYEFIDPYAVTEYRHVLDEGLGYIHSEHFPFPYSTDYFWMKGQVKSKKVYKYNAEGNFSLVSKEVNTYKDTYVTNNIEGYKYAYVGPHALTDFRNLEFEKFTYEYTNGHLYPETTETYIYDEYSNARVRQFATFLFENEAHMQLTRKTESVHDEELITKYYYPLDFPGNADVSGLVSKNIVATPVEVISWQEKNDRKAVLSGKKTVYNGDLTVDKVQSTEFEVPEAFTDESTVQDVVSGVYTDQVQIKAYDQEGNMLSYASEDDVVTSHIWGYTGRYPMAEVVNAEADHVFFTSFETQATYAAQKWTGTGSIVSSAASKTGKHFYELNSGQAFNKAIHYAGEMVLSLWVKGTPQVSGNNGIAIGAAQAGTTDGRGWRYYEFPMELGSGVTTISITGSIQLDEVRIYPKGAKMKTLTYDPPIGLISETDENNMSRYYQYDDFGRLIRVKDDDQNILQTYKYNYRKTANTND